MLDPHPPHPDPTDPQPPARPDPDHRHLLEVARDHALVVNEAQAHFFDWLGPFERYHSDDTEPVIYFDEHPIRVQWLGSVSNTSRTWLWAWANPGFATSETAGWTEAATWLRDQAPRQDEFWQLRTPLFPIPLVPGQPEATWPVSYLAFTLLRPKALFSLPHADGRSFLSIHDEAVPWAQPDPDRFADLLTRTLHRAGGGAAGMIRAYARWYSLPLTGLDADRPDRATLHFGPERALHLQVSDTDVRFG
ncbi:DUF6882 domain-containing protein [Granulicoccus phenolivorans]|uniref:DUF6882 domain-containing protein n=1 Tax=Granulicoccus phenolivorans TaxID=266854 RepID=UPI0003FDFA5C|nr:DUF6882 domain-containing protein [Granulicoccus phenolivorans]